jgi:protein-tyrosine phosphatase
MANDVWIDIKRISGNAFNSKKVILFLNEIFINQNKDVPDPWYGEEDGYHKVFDLIDKTCDEIIKKYKTK